MKTFLILLLKLLELPLGCLAAVFWILVWSMESAVEYLEGK